LSSEICTSSIETSTCCPTARGATLGQRRQHADGAEDAAAQVADRDARCAPGPVGETGDRHAATHALHHLVEGRPVGFGAGLAEAGNRAGHDARG
jgi:hypothetical protein